MTATTQEGPRTHAQLRRAAIHDALTYVDRPKKWRIIDRAGWGAERGITRYFLKEVRREKYARHTNEIEINEADWTALNTAWKRNQYGRHVGVRSLRACYEIITGENLRAAITAQQNATLAEEELMRQHQHRRDVAQTLRAAVDELMREQGLVIPGRGVMAKAFLIGAMRDTLNVITQSDAKAAEHVAHYFATGWPRKDGPRSDD